MMEPDNIIEENCPRRKAHLCCTACSIFTRRQIFTAQTGNERGSWYTAEWIHQVAEGSERRKCYLKLQAARASEATGSDLYILRFDSSLNFEVCCFSKVSGALSR